MFDPGCTSCGSTSPRPCAGSRATFIGIVIPGLKTRPLWAAAITAGLVATLLHHLPYQSGLMLGALAGVGVGLVLDLRRKKLGEPVYE